MKSHEDIIMNIRIILKSETLIGFENIQYCILFLLIRFLDSELCDKIGISEDYSYENILYEDITDDELCDKFNDFIDELKIIGIEDVTRFEIKGSSIKQILIILKDFDTEFNGINVDIVGTVYEIYFKHENAPSIKELCKNYTDRLIINYMISVCPIFTDKGIIDTISDPTMGTSGILSHVINHINNKCKKINWGENKDKTYGCDSSTEMRNISVINLLIQTREVFPVKLSDSLKNDIGLAKVKVIMADIPTEVKNMRHAECCSKIKNLRIRGTKSEPLFLQLCMESLEKMGRCCIIVPDSALFGNAGLHMETRRHLVENYNVKKIIKINKSNKSILYFVNNKSKTQKVELCEITIDKKEVKENMISKISYDDIVDTEYNLSVNRYSDTNIRKAKGTTYKQLGDVCHFKNGSPLIKAKFDDGDYLVIGNGKSPIGTHNKFNMNKDTILCSSMGQHAGHISMYNQKVWATDCFSITSKNPKIILNQYLYYVLLELQTTIYAYKLGNHLTIDNIKVLEIPVPSIEAQKFMINEISILKNKIEQLESEIEHDKKKINTFIINYLINNTSDSDDSDDDTDSSSDSESYIKPLPKSKTLKMNN